MSILEKTQSVCPECFKAGKINRIDAVAVDEGNKVFLIKECKKHGRFKEIYWDDVSLYKKAMKYFSTGKGVSNPQVKGADCPNDCGLCVRHKSQSVLTNIIVTNRCNLRCSYCFANAGAAGYVYEPTIKEIKKMLLQIRNEKPVPGKALQLSLDSEEKILVRDSDGRVFYKKIGEFVDNNMKDQEILMQPIKHEKSSVSGWEVLTLDKKLNAVFKPVKHIIRHKTKEKLFEIETSCGYKIRTTGSHSIFILNQDGEIIPKNVSELKTNENLISSVRLPPNSAIVNDIDMLGYFLKEDRIIHKIRICLDKEGRRKVKKLTKKKVGNTVGLHKIKDYLNEIDFEYLTYYNSRNSKILPKKLQLTPEVCRLLGYFLGEGCTYKNGVVFTFGLTEKENIEDCKNCIRKVLGNINIRERTAHNSATQLYIESYLYKILFEKIFDCGKNAKSKRIPWFVYNISESLKKEFLKAYFKCDGNVRTRSSGFEINYSTASKELAKDLIVLNLQIGILSRVEESLSKGHLNAVTNNFVIPSRKYKIVIGGKENLSKSLWLIDGKNLDKFKAYISAEERHSPQFYRIPILNPINDLNKFKGSVKNDRIQYFLKSTRFDKSISKDNLREIVDYYQENDIPFDKTLNDISHGDITILKIRKIRKVKSSSKYVYDISVDGEMFFSGLGLILAHNTGGEPTIRDDLIDIIKLAKKVGFAHVQLNTNAVRIAEEPELAKKYKAAGLNTVYMSFDGFKKNPWINVNLKAIESFRQANLGIVLVPTVIKTRNDDELGKIIKFAAENVDIIRGVNFQPVSFVGRIDKLPERIRKKERITYSGMIMKVEEQMPSIRKEDWYPVPFVLPVSRLVESLTGKPQVEFTCHSSCGGATYVFVNGDEITPITRVVDVEGLMKFIDSQSKVGGSLRKAKVAASFFSNINKFINKEEAPKGFDLRKLLVNAALDGSYESLRQFHYKSLYIGAMWFQDVWNMNIGRLERCVIHYTTPDGIIPFCAYNGLGYGARIEKKHGISIKEWEKRSKSKMKEDLWKGGPVS